MSRSDPEPPAAVSPPGGSRFARWRSRVFNVLDGYGVLVGLGLLPLPATVITLLVGWFGGHLVTALVVALGISLVVNAVLATVIWRRRYRHRFRLRPRPSYYRDQNDLDSLTLTSVDLEAWWSNAIRVAREQAGPDAEAFVESIHLYPSPFVALRGQSIVAHKHFAGTVSGAKPEDVSWYGIFKIEGAPMSTLPPPLWRSDDTWRELLHRAWLRERPVKHGVVMYERADASGRYWQIHFSTYMSDDQRLVPSRVYSIRDGQLRVVTV